MTKGRDGCDAAHEPKTHVDREALGIDKSLGPMLKSDERLLAFDRLLSR